LRSRAQLDTLAISAGMAVRRPFDACALLRVAGSSVGVIDIVEL